MSVFEMFCMVVVVAFFGFFALYSNNKHDQKQVVAHKKRPINLRMSVRILGLKIPKEYGGYAREASGLFQRECVKHSIGVNWNSIPDIFVYLRVLSMKGLHLELAKDDRYVQYHPIEGEYLGTTAWQNKWNRIIFSSSITKVHFSMCIRKIMDAHNITDQLESVYGIKIDLYDSLFIFRILHVMNYKLLVKENSSTLLDYEISMPSDFEEKQPYPQSNDHYLKLLSDLVAFSIGREVSAPNIRLEGRYDEIIYLDNIVSKRPDLKATSGVKINGGSIVLGLKFPFDIKIWNKEAFIAENVIGIEVKDDTINYEYLYLLLKLQCYKYRTRRVSEIDLRMLQEIEIVVIPSYVQHEIIEKCRPFGDDVERIKDVLKNYEEEYPLLGLVSKTIIGSL